jgi:hypothetical protein
MADQRSIPPVWTRAMNECLQDKSLSQMHKKNEKDKSSRKIHKPSTRKRHKTKAQVNAQEKK